MIPNTVEKCKIFSSESLKKKKKTIDLLMSMVNQS